MLGPVEISLNGEPAIPDFGSKSQNTNGNSVLLRFDYGKTRTLLTGDLNSNSQRRLLEHFSGRTWEFSADVAKACPS